MSQDNPFSNFYSVCFIKHCHYLMFLSVSYLSVALQLFLLSWLKKVHCLQEIMESHQCSLVQCCWSSRILLPWCCRKSVRKWYRALSCSLLSSCSCGYLRFYMVACTTLTCPMQPFPQLCTTTTGWYCRFCPVALSSWPYLFHSFMSCSAEQTVNLLLRIGALIQWQTSQWSKTENMYVLCNPICESVSVRSKH